MPISLFRVPVGVTDPYNTPFTRETRKKKPERERERGKEDRSKRGIGNINVPHPCILAGKRRIRNQQKEEIGFPRSPESARAPKAKARRGEVHGCQTPTTLSLRACSSVLEEERRRRKKKEEREARTAWPCDTHDHHPSYGLVVSTSAAPRRALQCCDRSCQVSARMDRVYHEVSVAQMGMGGK